MFGRLSLIVREARRKHKKRLGTQMVEGVRKNFGSAQIETTLAHGSEELTRSINY